MSLLTVAERYERWLILILFLISVAFAVKVGMVVGAARERFDGISDAGVRP